MMMMMMLMMMMKPSGIIQLVILASLLRCVLALRPPRSCRKVQTYLDLDLDALGFLPPSYDRFGQSGAHLSVDLYTCLDKLPRKWKSLRGRKESKRPLLLFACGAPLVSDIDGQSVVVGKAAYSQFATKMAKYGYVVAVMEKPVKFLNLNAAIPDDVKRTMDFVQSEQSPVQGVVDMNVTILSGHSFGAATALYTLVGKCNPMFCGQGIEMGSNYTDVLRPPEIKAAVLYGGSVFQVQPGPTSDYLREKLFTNDGIPILLFWGFGDKAVHNEWDGELMDIASYEQMTPPKYMLVEDGINHDSIANMVISHFNAIPSLLDRENQIDRVTRTFHSWIDYEIDLLGDSGGSEDMEQDVCDHVLHVPNAVDCVYDL